MNAGAQPPLQLTLPDAEKLAVQNNPQFRSAQNTERAAQQVPAEVRSVLFPTVTGNVTGVGADAGSRLAAGALNNPIVYNRLASGVNLNQMVTDFGRTHNLVEAAKYRAQAQAQATETTREDILLETDRAYLTVLRDEAVLRVARETVSARQLVANQVGLLAQNQLRSSLDVSFAQVNLADAQLLLNNAQNDEQSARAALATVLGLPTQTNIALTDLTALEPMPSDISALVEEAIRKRPELADLRLEENAAKSNAEAERDLSRPTLSMVGVTGIVPAGDAQLPGRFGALGLNLSIPIFNGGLFRARQREAEYRARAASDNVKDLENRIMRDVRVAVLNAQSAYERIGLTDKLLAQAKLALDFATGRYKLGLSSIIELSQAQLNYTSAQISSSTARYDYQTQLAELRFQAGSLH
ncbi:MAG TPA: TolC family protein [Solibacterales bacterium]|nr:TolC family protein [Bryobacterales bacterium]